MMTGNTTFMLHNGRLFFNVLDQNQLAIGSSANLRPEMFGVILGCGQLIALTFLISLITMVD